MEGATREPRRGTNVLGLGSLLLLFPLGVAFIVGWLLATIALHLGLLAFWLPRGRRILFVSSENPRWKTYLDQNVLPRLPRTAVVLDGSQRARWPRFDLGVWFFKMWSGDPDDVPVVMVFRPWRAPKIFRFSPAFEGRSRGNPVPLRELESSLLSELAALGRPRRVT